MWILVLKGLTRDSSFILLILHMRHNNYSPKAVIKFNFYAKLVNREQITLEGHHALEKSIVANESGLLEDQKA